MVPLAVSWRLSEELDVDDEEELVVVEEGLRPMRLSHSVILLSSGSKRNKAPFGLQLSVAVLVFQLLDSMTLRRKIVLERINLLP